MKYDILIGIPNKRNVDAAFSLPFRSVGYFNFIHLYVFAGSETAPYYY